MVQSKHDFLANFTSDVAWIEVNGTSVYLRPLAAGDVRDCRAWQKDHGDDRAYQILFVRSVVNEYGSRLFTDADAECVDALPFAVVNAVVEEVMKLNRMGGDAKKAPSPGTTS